MNPNALDALLAVLHHWAVFSLVAVLVGELVLARGPVDARRLAQLGALDRAYGLIALLTIGAGFIRAVYGAKGWGFYAGNPVFWAKIGVFAAIGLLSIKPTVTLIGWRRQAVLPDAAALRELRRWIHLQVGLLPLLPLLAVLMARGIGH